VLSAAAGALHEKEVVASWVLLGSSMWEQCCFSTG